MYRILPQSQGNVLGYRCSGSITRQEIQEIHREIMQALEEHGKVRFLLHLADLQLPEAKAVVEDLKLTRAYLGDVERYAIVGDAKWHDWVTGVVARITKGDARHFDARDLDEAWDWVLQT